MRTFNVAAIFIRAIPTYGVLLYAMISLHIPFPTMLDSSFLNTILIVVTVLSDILTSGCAEGFSVEFLSGHVSLPTVC